MRGSQHYTKPVSTVLSPPLAFVQENWLSFCSPSRWIAALAGSVWWSFYSAIQLPKCAFIASVTPIINYSPQHGAGLAGCYGNGTTAARSTVVTRCCCDGDPCLSFCWLFCSIVCKSCAVSQTQLTALNHLSQIWNFKDYTSHHSKCHWAGRGGFYIIYCKDLSVCDVQYFRRRCLDLIWGNEVTHQCSPASQLYSFLKMEALQ